MHDVEIDLASQLPKQDDNEEDFHLDATPSSDSAAATKPATVDVNALLVTGTQRDGEAKDD